MDTFCLFRFDFRSLLLAVLALGVGAVLVPSSLAQIQHGGTPYTIGNTVPGNAPVEAMPSVDVEQLKEEDRANRARRHPRPPRFGKAIDVSLGLQTAGRWRDLSEGGRLWRLRIASRGAHSLNFIFDKFNLPPGAELFLYNQDQSTILGAFTAANNKPYGRFSTLPIEGSVVTLEYYEPEAVAGEGELRLSKVVHGYRDLFGDGGIGESLGFGQSASCNNNVNCSVGDAWQDENGSIALIFNDEGQRWCSGSLIRNVPDEQKPYFLSAAHCADDSNDGSISSSEEDDLQNWTFWFNYQSATCSDPSSEPGHDGVSGAYYKDSGFEGDFLLMELSESPPIDYDTYYNGWNSNSSPPRSSPVVLHHPQGDIKKISLDDEQATSDSPNFKLGASEAWEVQDWDDGTTEGGSSGAPLYNENHRIIGINSYGISGTGGVCDVKGTGFGKFSVAWGNGLSAYLDPGYENLGYLSGEHGRVDVSVSGDTYLHAGEPGTWSIREVYGTDGSHSIDWYYTPSSGSVTHVQSGGTSYSREAPDEDFEIAAKITYNGQQGSDAVQVTVSSDGGGGLLGQDPAMSSESQSSKTFTPDEYDLRGNSPNPFRNETSILLDLPEEADVTLTVHNVLGQRVARLVNGSLQAGRHRIQWAPDDLASGVYVYRVEARDYTESKQAVLVR
jgi:hypothetical protein